MSIKTVIFNVGGHKYEVSRSLLSSYPNTMLACSASKHWQEDPESEIFIERDGERFKFCLDYLRDGRAMLPIVISKEAVIQDLMYYGVDIVDENAIDYCGDKGSQLFRALTFLQDEIVKAEEEFHTMQDKSVCTQAAIFCIKKYMATNSLRIHYTTDKRSPDYTNIDVFKVRCRKDMFNECLFRFGLKLDEKNTDSNNIALSRLED